MKYYMVTKCRVCGSDNISTIMNLGRMPLANSLKKHQRDKEEKYPLTLAFCRECSLVQIRETVDKNILFRQYCWVTGTSSAACDFADAFFKKALRVIKLKKKDLVIEIASNDGTYLKPFIMSGFNVLGIDPAENIAKLANESGIHTINAFWNMATGGKIRLEYDRAKFIFARNVIAHVSELRDFIAGINEILADEGVGAIEFHYAGAILRGLQYDSIYHEHLCYFSIETAERLLGQFGLGVFHIEKSPISGGAYILYFSKCKRLKTIQYKQLKVLEKRLGVNRLSSWKKFARLCIKHKKGSRALIASFNKKKIVGFGSSARSSTYLNFCGFDNSDISAIIDNNRLKQGLFSAGSSIPIVSMEEGLRIAPDLLFVLAWNFKDEIIGECRKNGYGGSYLMPFPKKPHFLNG